MPKRKRPARSPSSRKPTFLRQWRIYRKLSQTAAGERLGVTQPTLSKIENGELPYNQDLLESAAMAYGAHDPADLLQINPLQVDTLAMLIAQFRAAPPDVQRRAKAVVEALLQAS